jgi:hypothetical protein
MGRLLEPLAKGVVVLHRVELVHPQLVHQSCGQTEFRIAHLSLRRLDLLGIPDLVGEEQRVEHQPAIVRPNGGDVLLPAPYELKDCREPRVRHRSDEQGVRLLATLVGAEVVR